MISNHISCEFHRFFFFKHMTELFLNVNECLIQEICINITSPLNLQCLLKFCKKKKKIVDATFCLGKTKLDGNLIYLNIYNLIS